MKKITLEQFAIYIAPPILWMTIIFIFSSYPTVKTSEVYINEFIIKKSAHVIEYGILALLIFRALKNTLNISIIKNKFYAVAISTFYGLTDEFHQQFTSGREPKIRDVFFDFLGAWLVMYLILNILYKSKIYQIKMLVRRMEV